MKSAPRVEVKLGTRRELFGEITKFEATKLNLKLCNCNFPRTGRFNLNYDVRANRRKGRRRVLTLDLRLDASVQGAQEHLEGDFRITDFSRNCFGFV